MTSEFLVQIFSSPYNFFSRTTWPISAKLVGNMIGGWGFRFVQIKGLAPIRGKIRKIWLNLQKSSSHEPLAGIL